ncbi:hypothetical protein [Sphingobium sp.]|uniref:hypothetical protein n=1 Tax=Sphingobium sp. TaxID=1912891 RepID=UPI003BB5DD35
MGTRTYFRSIAQMLGVIILLVLLTVMPSQRGTMLLWPIGSQNGKGVAAIAIAAGAVLVGRSANGALIVQGERARLLQAMLPHAIIPLAASTGFCGSEPAGEA